MAIIFALTDYAYQYRIALFLSVEIYQEQVLLQDKWEAVLDNSSVKPFVIVLRWQLYVTIAVAVALALLLDLPSAFSAFLGGMVSIISSVAFTIIVSRHRGFTAGGTIRTALRAESVKIFLTIILLWAVFKVYDNVNAVAFIGTFILIVIMQSMVLFVSDSKNTNHID